MNLAELSIKRPIFISCLVLLMLITGYASLKNLSVDLFPDVTFPVVTVITVYQGAGPSEIETLVTKPMEDEISTISGLKRITSQSIEGLSKVVAEFKLEIDIKYAEQQVRDKAAIAKTKIPKTSEEPIIRRIDPADQPIYRVALQSNLPASELFDIADKVVKVKLQQIDNIGLVSIVGGRKREIQVQVDRKKLEDRQLSISLIAAQLSASGEDIPIGKIKEGSIETVYKSLGQFSQLEDIENTSVFLLGNEIPTKVKDLAKVTDTLVDESSRVTINGIPGIAIEIFKQTGTNTLAVVESIKKELPKLQEFLSQKRQKVELRTIQDGSEQIKANITDVRETIFLAIILTIIVVFLFLGSARSTLITALALPNSLLGTFILMALFHFTINVVTLTALVLTIGLLVDDAIVVRENIFRKLEEGLNPFTAARTGTKEVQLAVIATTLVVMAVFGPVAFTKGIIGQFLKQFGLTVVFAMAISLFDALTIAPMLSCYFAADIHKKAANGLISKTLNPLLKSFDTFQNWLENNYEIFLRKSIKHPILIVVITFIVSALGMSCIIFLPKVFLPPQDTGEYIVKLDLPPGTNLPTMSNLTLEIEKKMRTSPTIETTIAIIGGSGEPNKAEIFVKLIAASKRPGITTTLDKQRARDILSSYPAASPKVIDYDPTGANRSPFQLNILSDDKNLLETQTAKILSTIKSDKRLVDADTTYRLGKPELQVVPNLLKIQALGISTKSIGQELRTQVEGITTAKFRVKGEEYDIRVRLEEEQRDLKKNFKNIYVANSNQKMLKLSQFSKLTETIGPASINRQDRSRFIQITADLAKNASQAEIMSDYAKSLTNGALKLPPGMRFRYVGDSENFQELGGSMITALSFALIFIYLVLSSLYESFITPLTIMLSLPLAIIGAFMGLLVMHESINLFANLGIFLLIGVAAKNSILVVDYAKQLTDAGESRIDAIIKAGKIRLRPILMTSFALIAGTIPLAIGLNEASKQRTSMGAGIIGGTISSTLLSLIVIPSVYILIDTFRVWFEKKFKPTYVDPQI